MDKRIIVIGAGASGIAAATRLVFAGFKNVVVLEAENRIGGRIFTIPCGENVLDMGAQWCHGEKDNVVFGLAKNKNLLSSNIPRYTSFQLIRSDGSIVPQQLSDKLTNLALRIIDANEDEKLSYKGSLGNYFKEKYSVALAQPEYNDIDEELSKQFFNFIHKYENSHEASDSWYDTSCQGHTQYWICEGDPLLNWKDQGYRTVFDLLQKKVPRSSESIDITDRVYFNKKVSKISYNQIGDGSDAVRISCDDGSSYAGDHLICTVSLGVLKERHLSLFEPHLPVAKSNSIDGLSFGTVDKIYVEFDKPFWTNGWEGFSLLWMPDAMQKFRETNSGRWLEDVFGFYTLNFQPNILCGWISGPSARQMESETDDKVKVGVMRLLRMFLKHWNVPEPKSIIRSRWFSNENFRGSYTFYSLESDAMNARTSNLAEPITQVGSGTPIIQFGGEATHEHYYSTVHGAIESGWREAKRLIDFYRIKSSL